MKNEDRQFFRSLVYHYYKKGKESKEIFEELKLIYNKDSPNISFIYNWMKRFRLGYTSIQDEPRSGRPMNTEDGKYDKKLLKEINKNPYVSTLSLSKIMHSSMTKTRNYLKINLDYRMISCKWVPYIINEDQKKDRVEFCKKFLNVYGDIEKRITYNLVTGDETFLRYYDPLTGPQSKVWTKKGNEPQISTRKSIADKKIMVSVFFSRKGVEGITVLKSGEKATAKWYRDFCLDPLIQNWNNTHSTPTSSKLKIHHDNARPHTSNIINEYIKDQENVDILKHPPYSPDLSPCDFWLFPNIKNKLKGTKFTSESSLFEAYYTELNKLSKDDFKKAFIEWIKRCKAVISKNGNYY